MNLDDLINSPNCHICNKSFFLPYGEISDYNVLYCNHYVDNTSNLKNNSIKINKDYKQILIYINNLQIFISYDQILINLQNHTNNHNITLPIITSP